MSASAPSEIVKGATLSITVQNRPWSLGYKKHKLKPVQSVVFTCEATYDGTTVKMVPEYNAPSNELEGWKVVWYSNAHEDPEIVERFLGFDDAVDVATNQMDELTPSA